MRKILMVNITSTVAIMLLFISLAIPQLNGKETKYKQVEWQKELPIKVYISDVLSGGKYVNMTIINVYITNPYLPYRQWKYDNETQYCYQIKIYANNTVIKSFDKSQFVATMTGFNDGNYSTAYDGKMVSLYTDYTENLSQFSAIGFYRKSEPYYVDVFRYDILEQYLINGLLFSGLAVLFEWSFVKKKLGKILLLNFVASLIVCGLAGLLMWLGYYLPYAIGSPIGNFAWLTLGIIFYGLGFWGMIIITSILTAFIFCMAFTVAIWIVYKILKKTYYWFKKD